MLTFRSFRRLISLSFVAVTLLAGCAAFKPATPEEAVKARALQYWHARKDGKVDQLYGFLTPAFRKLRTEAQFRASYTATAALEAVEVAQVACESAIRCTAKMKLSVKPALPGLNLGIIDMHVDETWLLEDGQWWRHQDV